MIEQRDSQLILTFPSEESAAAFAQFLQSLLASATSAPSSESPLVTDPLPSPLPSTDLSHSRHTVLTPERQDALSRQRELGLTSRQRLLRAQTTLTDGVLPFRNLEMPPEPSGQESPRIRAARQGGFADGAPEPAPRRGSQLRLVARESGPATLLVPLSPAK